MKSKKAEETIYSDELGKAFGIQVVKISALRETQIDELANVAEATARRKGHMMPVHRFSGGVEHALGHIEEVALHDQPEYRQRWYAVKPLNGMSLWKQSGDFEGAQGAYRTGYSPV